MKHDIRRNVTVTIPIIEKFSMIYMEIRPLLESPIIRLPTRQTVWHLEDEQRYTRALCGLNLIGVCVSVSPALAMFGTPCKDCLTIVRNWLINSGIDLNQQFMTLIQKDIQFRSRVKKVVPSSLFEVNMEPEPEPEPQINKPERSRNTAKTKDVPKG